MQHSSHRVWSKGSPSAKSIRDKIFNDCIEAIRSKRKRNFLNHRMIDTSSPSMEVDELITASVQKHVHDKNFPTDIEYDILADIEFMSELEDAIRLEMESEAFEEYIEDIDELAGQLEDQGEGILCPVCRQMYLMPVPDCAAVACSCGVTFGLQESSFTDKTEQFMTEVRDRIATIYDRHYSSCSLRDDASFASQQTLQFQCVDERLNGWCKYCGFCEIL